MNEIESVALIGGTGRLGRGLGMRLARSGAAVFIGSRDAGKAAAAAASIAASGVRGATNAEAAGAAGVIVIAVPYQAHRQTVTDIAAGTAGKVVVDAAVPVIAGATLQVDRPAAGSLAEEAARLLPEARIVGGFHTVSAVMLSDLTRDPQGDVLLCGDDATAKEVAAQLVRAVGMRPVDAGGLAAAHTLEQLAGLLFGLNRRYRRRDLGIRITGLEDR